jgi:[ribosomal protein S5]-alanine N-acetyltransferase
MKINTQLDEIALKKWTDKHIEQLPQIANNLKIAANMADKFPSPYKLEHANTWIQETRTHPDRLVWAIESKGQLVGGIGLSVRAGSTAHCAGLVYWIGEQYWGNGYATEAVRTVVTHAFVVAELVRIETTVFKWNTASMRVLEKCQFSQEAILRDSFIKDGKIVDRHLFSIVCSRNRERFEHQET